ncbi:hypothetical protein EVAR_97449_1 [Eumeta japonica]|uniref:Uncharacterized protein n=1 Tax=Eumeta variegata TaxID=151549 RepID=A0A4C1WX47_EUMVA|nr:hypothetical protein EVAR_97449_1 [Eumeta japonica]
MAAKSVQAAASSATELTCTCCSRRDRYFCRTRLLCSQSSILKAGCSSFCRFSVAHLKEKIIVVTNAIYWKRLLKKLSTCDLRYVGCVKEPCWHQNDTVEKINKKILDEVTSETSVYNTIDKVISSNNTTSYPVEFLNSLELSGVPSYKLELKGVSSIRIIAGPFVRPAGRRARVGMPGECVGRDTDISNLIQRFARLRHSNVASHIATRHASRVAVRAGLCRPGRSADSGLRRLFNECPPS